MSSFLFTPMTRFYAEALEYMKNVAGGAVKEVLAEAGERRRARMRFPETLQGQCGISL